MKSLVLFLVLIPAVAGSAGAGPVFDPFLESFQVGGIAAGLEQPGGRGLPADLLAPVAVDAGWVRTALAVLDGDPATSATSVMLAAVRQDPAVAAWVEQTRSLLAGLQTGDVASLPQQGPAFGSDLWFAAGAAAFSDALAAGLPDRALAFAENLAAVAAMGPPRSRLALVWDLRARQLRDPDRAADRPWPALLDLGPYDANSGWEIWRNRRRQLGLPLLGRQAAGRGLAAFLAGLRAPDLAPADLAGSGFPPETIAGLGGVVLATADLAGHYRRYADPPPGFSAQGWWVSGRRRMVRGQASAYEELAGRPDLRSGWRLDLWRRASELRLLRGDWESGLRDLDRALAIARDGGATASLRLRLRQWVEQAMVLALAQGDTVRAAGIHARGSDRLRGEDLQEFRRETSHWEFLQPEQWPGPAPAAAGDAADSLRAVARWRVSCGMAAPLAPAGAAVSELAKARTDLWEPWRRWGTALAGRQTGDLPAAYAAALGPADPADAPRRALRAATALLAGREELPRILDHVLARDVYLAMSGRTPAPSSAVPSLAGGDRAGPLFRHALLAVALYQEDMRGILGAAVLLPTAGLSAAEKMLFLYPLPRSGPIFEAISAAGSEPALLLAVARNESLFDAGVRSRAGALGWMQIMPFHYPQGGAVPGAGHWSVPGVSIAKGDALLLENRRRFGGDPYLTLAGYNAGPEAARRWQRQLGGEQPADIYLAWIGYPETRRYVEKVLIDREIYAAILGGGIPGISQR